MAAFHYRRMHTAAERDLDASTRQAEAECRRMERQLATLDDHIAEARRLATATDTFDPAIARAPRERRRMRRHSGRRVAPRLAVD
jgi:hypothetical protein